MATEVRWRRGTETEHDSFTGAEGEVTVDTTDKRAVVHDGSTPGGHPAAKEDEVAKTANNLSDLDDASSSRSNLGLGSAATHDDTEYEDAGTAQSLMDSHESAADPHTQYAQLAGGASADFALMPLIEGLPIVEKGVNPDGGWVKFEGGYGLAWRTSVSVAGPDYSEGSVYRTDPQSRTTWTFPIEFNGSPSVHATSLYPKVWACVYQQDSTHCEVSLFGGSADATSQGVSLFALGTLA